MLKLPNRPRDGSLETDLLPLRGAVLNAGGMNAKSPIEGLPAAEVRDEELCNRRCCPHTRRNESESKMSDIGRPLSTIDKFDKFSYQFPFVLQSKPQRNGLAKHSQALNLRSTMVLPVHRRR